jgi:RNA polymerase sigma-70 factor (ECF subfamily)
VHISDRQFDDWVREHQRLLFGIAYWWTNSRTDAEELTQEAFFQAYRSRDTLRDLDAVKGWLVGILRNCHSQMRRREVSRAESPLDELLAEPSTDSKISTDVLALHQSLRGLDERYRVPLVLFYFEELSYNEISQALELPLGTVMSRMARARKQLHKLMQTGAKLVLLKKANDR